VYPIYLFIVIAIVSFDRDFDRLELRRIKRCRRPETRRTVSYYQDNYPQRIAFKTIKWLLLSDVRISFLSNGPFMRDGLINCNLSSTLKWTAMKTQQRCDERKGRLEFTFIHGCRQPSRVAEQSGIIYKTNEVDPAVPVNEVIFESDFFGGSLRRARRSKSRSILPGVSGSLSFSLSSFFSLSLSLSLSLSHSVSLLEIYFRDRVKKCWTTPRALNGPKRWSLRRRCCKLLQVSLSRKLYDRRPGRPSRLSRLGFGSAMVFENRWKW